MSSQDGNAASEENCVSFAASRKGELHHRQEGGSGEEDRDRDTQSMLTTMQTVETTSSSGASTSSPLMSIAEREKENPDGVANQVSSAQVDDSQRLSWESGTAPVTSPSRVTVKLLVSNNMAGSIIGRSGQTISSLQSQSSSKIRLSQSGDYFPGTSDRICLIHGSLENVKKGIALVLGKLYALQLELVGAQLQLGQTTGQENDDSLAENETPNASADVVKMTFTARILISSAACGMLIGKEGASIKKLKDTSGATSVRLSPKVTDHRTFERILTVSGNDLQSTVSFAESLLEGFVRHPEICRYLNSTTSYSRSSNVTYAVPRNTGLAYSPPATNPVTNMPRPTYGQPHQAIHEIDAGMQGLTFEAQPGVASPSRGHRQPPYIATSVNAMNTAPVSSFHPTGQVLTQRPAQNLHPATFNSTINLAVPDSMIGAILGRRGQTLMELQAESGARIKVSQRDEFVPGTSNRIITISGTQESIATARNLIRQLLSRNP